MDPLLRHIASKQKEMVSFLRELVECESPSDDVAAVDRFVDLFAERVKDIAKVRTVNAPGFGRHLLCEFALPGPKSKPAKQILALGHSDTVWPIGTLRTMPWKQERGRLRGPGVFDMKGGLALFVFAMRALRELDRPVARKVTLQINSDEEVGSPSSRPLTEKQAQRSDVVLVLEPALGPAGKLKTARKGISDYTVRVQGISAHSGLDFEKGASAIIELAHQIVRIMDLPDGPNGLIVNPGLIHGGTRGNVVAERADVSLNVRFTNMTDFKRFEKRLMSIRPVNPRCVVSVVGGMLRPPFTTSKEGAKLLALAQEIGKRFGMTLEGASVGGASDGNFTSHLGVPTLDGLGAVGEGAHSPTESIVLDTLPGRAALLAAVTESFAEPGRLRFH